MIPSQHHPDTATPWLTVAGRELTGITVVDLDATIVPAAPERIA